MKSLLLQLSLIHRYLVCGHANQKMFHLYVQSRGMEEQMPQILQGSLRTGNTVIILMPEKFSRSHFQSYFINNIINIKTAPYAIVCNIALFFMQSDYFKNICIKLLFVFVYGWQRIGRSSQHFLSTMLLQCENVSNPAFP